MRVMSHRYDVDHGAQVAKGDPVHFTATLRFVSHAAAHVCASWRVLRARDPLSAFASQRGAAKALPGRPAGGGHAAAGGAQRLDHALRGTLGRVRHGVGRGGAARLDADSELGRAPDEDDGDVLLTEAFVASGALSVAVEVGARAGPHTCELWGMFLQAGLYEVRLQVDAVRDVAGGIQLPVEDYTSCIPFYVDVRDSSDSG
jgi:hypothetical protein